MGSGNIGGGNEEREWVSAGVVVVRNPSRTPPPHQLPIDPTLLTEKCGPGGEGSGHGDLLAGLPEDPAVHLRDAP